MRTIKLGISTKLLVGLWGIFIATVMISGISLMFFNRFHQNYQTISQQKLPSTVAASNLMKLTQRLISNAPGIVLAENQISRKVIIKHIAENEEQKDEILKSFALLEASNDDVKAIARQFDLLLDNLNQLNTISDNLIESTRDLNQVIGRLRQLIATEDINIPATIRNKPAQRELYRETKNILNKQMMILLILHFENKQDMIHDLENRFISLMHKSNENLRYLPVSEIRTLLQLKKEIDYYGKGKRDFFAGRLQQISLQEEIEENLVQNTFISTQLGKRVDAFFATIINDVDIKHEEFDKQIHFLSITLLLTPGITLLVVIAVTVYIRWSIISRILSLEKCMHANTEGRTVPIPIISNDEITSMAQSVSYFIDKRNEYEKIIEEAREVAEASNRAKSIFLANMSHELRTPLNAILGLSQLMRHDPKLDSNAQENLNIIHRSGEHLLTLINDILTMSKIEAGRTTLNMGNFDLRRLLADLKDMFQLKAKEKSIRLEFEMGSPFPRFVCTDGIKLRQILINLINNAIKFTDTGYVRVWAGKKSQKLLFQIEDTGKGIAPEDQENLFQPFFQTRSAQKEHEGTGLGLSISREFVQLMGGALSVSSPGIPGKGSVFSFYVEISDAEQSAMAERTQSIPSARVVGLEPGQPVYRILVADDHAPGRQYLTKLFSSLNELSTGFEIREARNGKEAVKIWEQWRPHLIWMDMEMPVMDGYEAAGRIRSKMKSAKSDTIILAYTAGGFEEEDEKILKAGCDDILLKPVRENDLFKLMEKHLGIRYIYEEGSPKETHLSSMKGLSSDDFSSLPPEWLAAFQDAIEYSDAKSALAIVGELAETNETLKEKLCGLVKNYRFDIIQPILEKIKK